MLWRSSETQSEIEVEKNIWCIYFLLLKMSTSKSQCIVYIRARSKFLKIFNETEPEKMWWIYLLFNY